MADEMEYMEQAKELADSYRLLVHRRDMLRQQYEDSRSWFYTKDEIIYKLSQGAHEESERVQNIGEPILRNHTVRIPSRRNLNF